MEHEVGKGTGHDPGDGHLLDSPRHPDYARKQPQGTRVAFQRVAAHTK